MASFENKDKLIYLIFKTDGSIEIVYKPETQSKSDNQIPYLDLKKNIGGGLIEFIDSEYVFKMLKNPYSKKSLKWLIVVDEEGICKNLRKNPFSIENDVHGDFLLVQDQNLGTAKYFPVSDLDLLPETIKKKIQ